MINQHADDMSILKKLTFNLEDMSQVMIGAFALAVPISFSEEAWRIGETIPPINLLMIFSLSLIFLAFFAYQSIFQRDIKHRLFIYIARIFIAYGITTMVVALILLSINKLPILDMPLLSLKRIIVISMPASMGAIIVDSFDKE